MQLSAMIGLAAIPLLTATAPPVSSDTSPVAAFVHLCLPADPAATAITILSQADAAGWHRIDFDIRHRHRHAVEAARRPDPVHPLGCHP